MQVRERNYEGNMYKIYQMDTKQLENSEVFDNYYKKVSRERRQKIDRFRMAKDKRLSLAAGVLFCQGLKEYGISGKQAQVAVRENGKPYLLDYPDIHFNISHSEQKVLVVFSDAEIGCDIEYAAEMKGLELAERFFCKSEYDYIVSREKKEQTAAFYRLWTLKESFLKATGVGLKLSLNHFRIKMEEEIQVEQQINKKKYCFKEWREGEYQAAICVPAREGK